MFSFSREIHLFFCLKLFSNEFILFIVQFVGCEFVPGGFLSSVPMLRVFLMQVLVNEGEVFHWEMEREQIWRELKKKIRRDIFTNKMTLTQCQELEEGMRREMTLERALGMPVQSPDDEISFQQWLPRPLNQRITNQINHINISNVLQP